MVAPKNDALRSLRTPETKSSRPATPCQTSPDQTYNPSSRIRSGIPVVAPVAAGIRIAEPSQRVDPFSGSGHRCQLVVGHSVIMPANRTPFSSRQ